MNPVACFTGGCKDVGSSLEPESWGLARHGVTPASRAGRGVMEEGSEAASIIAGQGEEQPGFAALLSEES